MLVRDIDAMTNNKYGKAIYKYLRWQNKYDSSHTIVIGHNNPLPDGDCICATHGFAYSMALLVNDMKAEKGSNDTIEIQYAASPNPYISKVLDYVDGVFKRMDCLSSMKHYPIKRSFDYFNDPNEAFENRIIHAIDGKDKKGLAIFVLDTDYQRTGYQDTLDRLDDIVKRYGFEHEDVFFGIIDHHIPKEGFDVTPKSFSDIDDNCFELIFPSNALNGAASSTCEIVMNILSTYSFRFKELDAFKSLDENNYKVYAEIYMSTMGKILMGGIRTDTGNLAFNGHGSAIMSIGEFIYKYGLKSSEDLSVDQNLIQSIVEPKKSIKNGFIYSYLHDNVESSKDGFAYLIAKDEEHGEYKNFLSENGIKPIHILQEYEWKAAVAITIDKTKRTLKLELRSTNEKYNCRKLAQAIHPTGGGHLQAAGVTIEVPEDKIMLDEANRLVREFIDYMRECEK